MEHVPAEQFERRYLESRPDAVLIEAPLSEIEEEVARAQIVMRQASEIVLDGFPLRTDAKIIRHPERYVDPRGKKMWDVVQQLLTEQSAPVTGNTQPISPATHASNLILSSI